MSENDFHILKESPKVGLTRNVKHPLMCPALEEAQAAKKLT